ncbi:uncharacterized protein LOC103579423 [Microplitis demolitor]|uniref:uncharacterized protein LOC103579423 n=1 Tax=Microplitis demolitor TaxID=69319 RepID=UPI0004CD369A|nr:uncharacterized protein LOC103579423 [Microplitis demolitor]
MKSLVVILCLFITVSQCQFLDMSFLDNMMENMNSQINNQMAIMHQQINDNIANQLSKVDQLISNIHNIPIPTATNGQTIIVNGGSGESHTVLSGTGADGKPYFRDITDRMIGSVLHRTERIYNPKTDTIETYQYTYDTSNPNAKPVLVKTDAKKSGN